MHEERCTRPTRRAALGLTLGLPVPAQAQAQTISHRHSLAGYVSVEPVARRARGFGLLCLVHPALEMPHGGAVLG